MSRMVMDISIFSQKELSNYDVSIISLLAVPVLPLVSLHIFLFVSFNCVIPIAKHYNGENETFSVKCGLNAEYAIADFYGSSAFAICHWTLDIGHCLI